MKDTICRYCDRYQEGGDLTMSFQEMIDDLDCTREDLIKALNQLQKEGYLSYSIYNLPGGIPYDEEISITIWMIIKIN